MIERLFVGDEDPRANLCPASHSVPGPQARWGPPGYRGRVDRLWDPHAAIDVEEAERFLRLFHAETNRMPELAARVLEVKREIADSGTYTHSAAELEFGARVAWRNASRCIGRLYWHSLRIRDRRKVSSGSAIYSELVNHLEVAGNEGNVRPVITVFAPAKPGIVPVRIWNEQLIRYAGYQADDDGFVGDPRYAEFTRMVSELGWRGAGGSFDVLPWVIQREGESPRLYQPPPESILEVQLSHPELDFVAALGLRWHAVPAISNMRLEIGGVSYPCAPFNGWYMGTEIGARNLADSNRYNLLPTFAQCMGLDTSSDATLWRDRALVELNRAVLHSFAKHGVRISDHHTEARRFLAHVRREERSGRQVPADWSWIIPPLSPATTGVWHRGYHEADLTPNFYLDTRAKQLAGVSRAPVFDLQ